MSTEIAEIGPVAEERPLVRYDVEAGVATLTFDRAETRNAWSPRRETAWFDALERAARDPEVRAIVVTGAGKAFCIGPEPGLLDAGPEPRDPRGDLFPTTVPKPIIAAINGPCVGIGLSEALFCDLRFAARDAKLTTGFAKVGLVAEHGTAWLLQRLAGPAVALDLLLSARVVDGAEAKASGIVNEVCAPEELVARAQGYARELATRCSPSAMAAIKAQVYADASRDLAASIAEADRLVEKAVSSEDFRQAVAAMGRGEAPRHSPLAAVPGGAA